MNDRIKKLTELTLSGQMYVNTVKTEFDREDLFLPKNEMDVKRLCEYILNQEPKITDYSLMTGFFRFDGSVIGDAFNRSGHTNTQQFMNEFYLKPIDNISTMEWQHAIADYQKLLSKGIKGIIRDIDKSTEIHKKPEEKDFLNGMKAAAAAMIEWAHKCSHLADEYGKKLQNSEYRLNFEKLSKALMNVPENPPADFYEAVLSIYVCFSANPDSLGTLDRYLTPYYENDINNGTLSKEQAKEYLQELFLMVQAATAIDNHAFTKGGQSHFCIGGYLKNGEDGFNAVSKLIVESLTELPTYIPEITFRWTKKTPRDVFKYMMECEKNDVNKRIAFTNDEKRIKSFTEICGFPYETAINYTMVGCNEPVCLGAIIGSNSKGNILRCVERLFHDKYEKIINLKTFDEFYYVFEKELFSDMDLIYDYDDKYNIARAKDINYISSIFFNDCVENAKSLTQGGGNHVISSPMLLGITNVIDSLCVVKQFVYDEKRISMAELVQALKDDWNGHENLREAISKTCDFFGNDGEISNFAAKKLYDSFYGYLKNKRNIFGYPILIADSLGYNEHHKWFGENTRATPDGRLSGGMLKFGIGQSGGFDRCGLTALLNSVSKADVHAVGCGSTVTNVSIDKQLVRNEDGFEKLVDMFEAYFKNGGVHFQLTYVSKDELIAAEKDPKSYENLRVRVTGFSDYFVNLKDSIRSEIIERTEHNG